MESDGLYLTIKQVKEELRKYEPRLTKEKYRTKVCAQPRFSHNEMCSAQGLLPSMGNVEINEKNWEAVLDESKALLDLHFHGCEPRFQRTLLSACPPRSEWGAKKTRQLAEDFKNLVSSAGFWFD